MLIINTFDILRMRKYIYMIIMCMRTMRLLERIRQNSMIYKIIQIHNILTLNISVFMQFCTSDPHKNAVLEL